MANLKKKFNEIMVDIEANVKNKEDLEYIKSQVYNISMLFLDELDKLAERNFNRLNVMLDREKELSKRISIMEQLINDIEKELFVSQDEDADFEIICPYCNTEFVEDFTDELKYELRCPGCGNVIELDWNEDEECTCEHECNGECFTESEEEENNDNEDDM